MDDETIVLLSRSIDIPARFIRQAYEHIQRSSNRYVPFRFTGERVEEAVCVGVGAQFLLTDQRPQPEQAPAQPPSPFTLQTLTDDVVLGLLRQKTQPQNGRQIGDALGIPTDDISIRQRLRRVLVGLVEDKMLRRSNGPGHFPYYAVTEKAKRETKTETKPETMPLRPQRGRKITRHDVTEDVLLAQLREKRRISSRAIGDVLGIPRPDNIVRGKITQLIAKLIKEGQVQHSGMIEPGGGKLYELVDEATAQAG
jgi:hypothetical protein